MVHSGRCSSDVEPGSQSASAGARPHSPVVEPLNTSSITEHPRNRLAAWYERTRRPGVVLGLVVLALYAPSLRGTFVLDDHRCIRHLAEFAEGSRERLDIYQFLYGGEKNKAEREDGWYPWWLMDEVRYRHFRPLAEWALYGEYLLFGNDAGGYRVVSLALYVIGVLLVLELFRLMGGDERLARWGALIFAVATCHTIPVVFISAQCDLLALALAAGGMVAAARFVRDGGNGRLVAAAGLYAAGLLAKEAVLPAAVLPLCMALAPRDRAGSLRRGLLATTVLLVIGLVYLGYYAAGGYGSNASLMLDPLGAPLDYLAATPGRVLALLTSWIIPLNPFVFWFVPGWYGGVWFYGAAGLTGLALLARMYWRQHRRQRGVAAMALWAAAFLPLLACTIPDDRVMVLPSIGLAFLGAAWMTRRRADGSQRLRTGPLGLFVILQLVLVLATTQIVQFMELEARRHLELITTKAAPAHGSARQVFMLNTARSFETLFIQDRYVAELGHNGISVGVLSEVVNPSVQIVNDHTLRLEATGPPFFGSFVGQMGTSRGAVRREGDLVRNGPFVAKITKVEDGQVRAIEFVFDEPLESERYRLYWSDPKEPPRRW